VSYFTPGSPPTQSIAPPGQFGALFISHCHFPVVNCWSIVAEARSDEVDNTTQEHAITSQNNNQLTFHLSRETAYWIAFGPHGPRSEPPANEGRKVALYTAVAVGVSFVIFAAMRSFAGPAPHTMTREWQEASNEYLKGQGADPFTGVASPDYKGKGQIQSPPKGA